MDKNKQDILRLANCHMLITLVGYVPIIYYRDMYLQSMVSIKFKTVHRELLEKYLMVKQFTNFQWFNALHDSAQISDTYPILYHRI